MKKLIKKFFLKKGVKEKKLFQLDNKVYIITGGGTGFGEKIAIHLLKKKCKVILIGRKKSKYLKIRNYVQDKKNFLHFYCDLNKKKSIENLIKSLKKKKIIINGIIFCAAVPQKSINNPILNYTHQDWSEIFMVNLYSSILLIKYLKNYFSRYDLKIIFFSSRAAWSNTLGFGPYNISKAAVNILASSLAEELKSVFQGTFVQVNAIDPGEAKSEMNKFSEINPKYIVKTIESLLLSKDYKLNGKILDQNGNIIKYGDIE